MYSVALVQNQSEMAHYGYADARPLINDYAFRLFTGDNIKDLASALSARQVDALVLGTNALNDKDIMAALCNRDFADCVESFLATGRGVLGLQQLGLAMRNGPTMTLLPGRLGQIRPKVVASADDALHSGELATGHGAINHVALTYPEVVDPKQVRDHACAFRSLPGLYWHYWDQVDLADWDQLIVDPALGGVRPLVIASKESRPGRVVASALPLDWQKHTLFFRNLLMFVAEGRHTVATVETEGDSATFDYLRETMRARRIPFGQYTLPGDTDRLARNVRTGVHATVVLGGGLAADELPAPLRATVEEAVEGSKLRVIGVGPAVFGTRAMSVLSRERRPHRLLQETELQLQSELQVGYIDDSFWSHVETLQTIDDMPDRVVDYGRLQEAAFAITRNHDRNGSYDEVFGATCAYYWLRARYLGAGSREARQTAAWLRNALPQYEANERALAYLMFARFEDLPAAESADLVAIVESLDHGSVRETELLQYLRALLAMKARPDLVASLATSLAARQRDGMWVDLTTTASVATALLGAHELLGDGEDHASIRVQIEAAAMGAVVFILRALARSEASPEPPPYPWDGKARTTTKCLQAWLRFEALQELPVYELLENLGRADRASTGSVAHRTALSVLQATNEENIRLRREAVEQQERLVVARRQVRRGLLERWVAVVTIYLLAATCIGFLVESDWDLGQAITTAFVDQWSLHLAVIGLFGVKAGVQAAIKNWRSNDDDPEEGDAQKTSSEDQSP